MDIGFCFYLILLYVRIMNFNKFITPDNIVPVSGPSVMQPNFSEQLRISGNKSSLGIWKNLK